MPFVQTPRDFMEKIVVPNWEDYRKVPDNERLALNAVLSCWHLSDWVWRGRNPEYWEPMTKRKSGDNGKQRFLTMLVEDMPKLEMLRSLSNGGKHFLDDLRHAQTYPMIDVLVTPYDPETQTEGKIVFGDKHLDVRYEPKDGSDLVVEPLTFTMEPVISWWPRFLARHGL